MGNSLRLLPEIEEYISSLPVDAVAHDRKQLLDQIAHYCRTQYAEGRTPALNFICTHNSRRSQLAQVWARTLSAKHGIEIKSFSGGTAVTAFNRRAIAALQNSGFYVEKRGAENPTYTVRFSKEMAPLLCFSKLYDDPSNPNAHFAAIMTCSDADVNCPFIPGADVRIPLRYSDPGLADGTPEEQLVYDARSRQIATELLYIFRSL